MSCLDCEDKARRKNEQIDALRSKARTEPEAVVEFDGELVCVSVEKAITQGFIIKEVLMPKV